MLKSILSSFILLSLLLFSTSYVHASMLVVKENGEVLWNVLSAEDGLSLEQPIHGDLGVQKVADVAVSSKTNISLRTDGNGTSIFVTDSSGTKQLDVQKAKDDLVEIVERPEVNKLNVGIDSGWFTIDQQGVVAKTKFPLKINSDDAKISLQTGSGEQYLSVFPYDAVQSALRTKLLTRVSNGGVEILDNGNKLQYKISGERVINLFNVYDYSIPVSSYVSASTGEMLKIEAPGWLKAINFLFS